jgi:enamine deaminase RidA (YjgF/YER057c/UK114 family)
VEKAFLNPAGLPHWEQSFSQIVVCSTAEARTIYISGQVSMGPDHRILAAGDLGAQARHAFANLKSALAAAGATPSDVVKLGIHVVNYRPEQAPLVTTALRDVFPAGSLPASTWLGVQSLALAGLLIEVDAIAVTPRS